MAKHAQADGADGRESEFDLIAGEFSGHCSTEPDTDGEAGVEIGDAVLVQVQKFRAVAVNVHQVDGA